MAKEQAQQAIEPNYRLIKKILPEGGGSISKKYFQHQFHHYKTRQEFEGFNNLLQKYQLTSDQNLYFFWVWYFDAAEFYNYLRKNKMFNVTNNSIKDMIKLKELFKDFKESYLHISLQKAITKDRFILKSISFTLIKKGVPKTTRITAHPVIYNLFRHLKDFLLETEIIGKPKEKNVKTYLNNFILSTEPFFGYMKDTHFKSMSKNKVYDFMVKFIATVGIDLELMYSLPVNEHIKSIYTKWGKSTLKKT